MEEDWSGKSVSIECDVKLGVFQGIIKEITETEITIVRAFRNGVPLRKQDAEITLRSSDIINISLIPSFNGQSTVASTAINRPTPIKQPIFMNLSNGALSADVEVLPQRPSKSTFCNLHEYDVKSNSTVVNKVISGKDCTNAVRSSNNSQHKINAENQKSTILPPFNSTVAQFFGNLIPPKVEARMGAFATCSTALTSNNIPKGYILSSENLGETVLTSFKEMNCEFGAKPIDTTTCKIQNPYMNENGKLSIVGNYSSKVYNGNCLSGNGINSGMKKQRKQLRRENSSKQDQTFATSVDDPLLHEDFDFEGNLALFNKQAIWDVIESEQKPDLVRQATISIKKKYRHDENILVGEPMQLRQIENMFDGSTDFVTDEGLIIPTIPAFVRTKIETIAEKEGLSLQRQIDILARGVTELAILLLGGARRLTPTNYHQWPKIVIICETYDLRTSNIGAATGRQLASHGLKVILYLKEADSQKKSVEVSLFKASGNSVVYSVNDLLTPDLVILSTNTAVLENDIKKWLSENRASVLSIDPPPSGIQDVSIKYSILPILPLNGISATNCGKLYLCNLGIPNKFYRDAGIKYKSPFGHKFVIPIHSKDSTCG